MSRFMCESNTISPLFVILNEMKRSTEFAKVWAVVFEKVPDMQAPYIPRNSKKDQLF